MKTCGKCSVSKETFDFHPNFSKKEGLQSWCKECVSSNNRDRYLADKQSYSVRRKIQREKFLALMAEVKDRPCLDCGIKYPSWVMEFDHLPQFTKIKAVSEMSYFGELKIREEIEKCELVCANCHRQRTHKRAHSSVD